MIAASLLAGLLLAQAKVETEESASQAAAFKIVPAVVDPDWTTPPDGAALLRHMSGLAKEAMDLGLVGAVDLRCALTAAGRLKHCQVLTESPMNIGLGLSTARSAERTFSFRPRLVDGVAVQAEVDVPVRFNTDTREPPLPVR